MKRNAFDYDDPVIDARWCDEMRDRVSAYLKRQRVAHGRIGEYPAWHVAPYVSVWAIESLKNYDHVGWWVICGDMPTDYVSGTPIKHPRGVLNAIAQRWGEAADLIQRGEEPKEFTVGSAEEYPQTCSSAKSTCEVIARMGR